jgi:hypothetical protein
MEELGFPIYLQWIETFTRRKSDGKAAQSSLGNVPNVDAIERNPNCTVAGSIPGMASNRDFAPDLT